MAVGCCVVGHLAESWVLDDLVEGVDGDDVTVETGSLEERLGLFHRRHDLVDSAGAAVDDFVADGDGVDSAPVAFGGVDDELGFVGDITNVPDAGEEFHVPSFSGRQDVGDLIAVGAVDAEGAVAVKGVEVLLDLVCGLARAIAVVWSI